MKYSDGMGVELPKWFITTKSNKKFFNHKLNKFENDLLEDCLFDTPLEAQNHLKKLDFGYVVKPAKLFIDLNNKVIRMV